MQMHKGEKSFAVGLPISIEYFCNWIRESEEHRYTRLDNLRRIPLYKFELVIIISIPSIHSITNPSRVICADYLNWYNGILLL